MSEVYVAEIQPSIENVEIAIRIARQSFRKMDYYWNPSQLDRIDLDVEHMVHLCENRSKIRASYSVNDKEIITIAELGATSLEHINPIDKKLGRLSVRMSGVRYAGVKLISGLYTNPYNPLSKLATDSLLEEFVNQSPELDTYVAASDNDSVVDSIIDSGFIDTGISHEIVGMKERLYRHSHNSLVENSFDFDPYMLGYMIIQPSKTANRPKSGRTK